MQKAHPASTSPVGLIVTEKQFQASIEKVRERVKDPKAGLFGPDSLAWKMYGRGMLIGLSAPTILILQTSHPYIAHGVQQHSNYRSDPAGRGIRTAHALYSWIFEDLDGAIDTAVKIRAVHHRVAGRLGNAVGPYAEGDAYTAADTNALLWVHSTLWHVPVRVYEMMYGPVSLEEKERYWNQTKLFALLFGIPEEIIPPTWSDFLAYFDRMLDTSIFTVDEAARITPKFMFYAPPVPGLPWLAARMKLIASGLVGPKLREQYGWRFTAEDQRTLERTVRQVRKLSDWLPTPVQFIPAYRHAMARVKEKQQPFLTRFYFRAENEAIRRLALVARAA